MEPVHVRLQVVEEILDVHRALFPRNKPKRFRLYGFDDLSLLDFDAYPIASIGYDKSAYVHEMVTMIAEPSSFVPGQPPVAVPTRFIGTEMASRYARSGSPPLA